mgnify:FL=1
MWWVSDWWRHIRFRRYFKDIIYAIQPCGEMEVPYRFHFLNFGQPGRPFKFNCFNIHFGESIITRHENWSGSHLFFPKLKVLAGTKKSFVFSHFNSISTVVSFKQILSSQMGKFTIHLLGKFLHVNFIYPLRGDS